MANILDDSLNSLLERGLDYAELRQKVLSNNIANINTPRFRRSDVSFSQMMRNAGVGDPISMGGDFSTNPGHFSLESSQGSQLAMFVHQTNDTTVRNDLNNVDINRETVESAKNAMYHQALTQLLARRFRMVSDVIRGR